MPRRKKIDLLPPAPRDWKEDIQPDIEGFPPEIRDAGLRILKRPDTEMALRYLLADGGKVGKGTFAGVIHIFSRASLGDIPASYSFATPKTAPIILEALRDFADIFKGTEQADAFRKAAAMVEPYTKITSRRGRPRRAFAMEAAIYQVADIFKKTYGRTTENAISHLLRATFGPGKYDVGHLLQSARQRLGR